MSLSRVLLHLNTRHAPAARGSQAPVRPPAPEPTPVPGSGPHDPPQAECGDCTPGLHCWQHDTTRNPPTDQPHRDTDQRWHASEAEALAKLADLTRTRTPWAAANDMTWSST